MRDDARTEVEEADGRVSRLPVPVVIVNVAGRYRSRAYGPSRESNDGRDM